MIICAQILTMRRNLFFPLILSTLVGMAGCRAPSEHSIVESWEFSIDNTVWILELNADIDKQRRIISSSLMVYPEIRVINGNNIVMSNAFYQPFRDSITSETDTLYFFRVGEKTIEKKYHELGIDISRLLANHTILDYLQPILEDFIRKNAHPSERETEK